jgi:hypothetical protein
LALARDPAELLDALIVASGAVEIARPAAHGRFAGAGGRGLGGAA